MGCYRQAVPIKRIPKACRLLWADALANALAGVSANPANANAWVKLLALPKLCLRLPPRPSAKKFRAFDSVPHLTRLLSMAREGRWSELFSEANTAANRIVKPFAHTADSKEAIQERVITLVQEGQLSKAVQALVTCCCLATVPAGYIYLGASTSS